MRTATRGRRAGRIASGVGAVALAIAWWGVPVGVSRVSALVDPDAPVSIRAAGAWLALRPLPTLVADDVEVTVKGGTDATFRRVAIGLAVGAATGGTAWRRARIRGGRLSIEHPGGGTPIVCDDVGGRVTPVDAARVRLDLGGACRGPTIRLGAVRYRGRIDWRGSGTVRSQGVATAQRPRIGVVSAAALEGRVRTGGDGVRVDALRIDVGDGAVVGRARWLRRGERRRVALRFEGSGGDATRVLAGPLHVTGRWVASGRGRTIVTNAPLGRGVSGSGRLVIVDGSVEPLDVGAALLDGLEVWRGRRRRRLRRRFPDVFGGKRLHFDRAVAVVRARTGRWDLAPVRMRSASYHAGAHGRVGRDGSVHGAIDVVPSDPLADALFGRGALRAIVTGGKDELVLPIEVSGRLGDLRVRPAPAFARGVLERALGGSSLGGVLERVLGR